MEVTGARQKEEGAAGLKRELGLVDIVLTQVVYVVGVVWVGAAAKLGHSQVVFWLAAMLLFYLPQAAVVIHLSRRMPLEGGLYQWAKLGLGEHAGFMVAWNLWMYAVVLIATIGLLVTTNLSYAFGASAAWMAGSKPVIAMANLLLIGGLTVLAVVGLGVGKWLHNAGSVTLMIAFAVLIILPFVSAARGSIPAYHPLAIVMPALTLFNLNIFGKMGMGALSGFEYVAVLAGECKDPERTIGRATIIAAPIIALMFILGTSAVLAYVPPDRVDLIGPIPQVFRAAFGSTGLVALAAPIAILLLTMRTLANNSIVFTGNTRMPMVAGWDHLLPQWFTRLDPRFRTPVNSILFVAAVSIAFSVAGILGVGQQEAFQLLDNAAGILYGLTYLVMFAIPIIGFRDAGPRPPAWLRAAAASGFATTLLYVVLSIFPIVGVASWLSFSLKISGVVVALNVLGVLVYLAALRRRRLRVRAVVATAIILCTLALPARGASAQASVTQAGDSSARAIARCDSAIRQASADSTKVTVRAYLVRTDGGVMSRTYADLVLQEFAQRFAVPQPLHIPVLAAGPATLRALSPETRGTASPRPLVVQGIYDFTARGDGSADHVTPRLTSLSLRLDSSVVATLEAAARDRAMPIVPGGSDSVPLRLTITSGAPVPGRERPLFTTILPRIVAVDASELPDNPAPRYPAVEQALGMDGYVLFDLVVGRDGRVEPGTVEVMQATSVAFMREAIRTLPDLRFTPAHVGACAVPQVMQYPFRFIAPTRKAPSADTVPPPPLSPRG